MRYKFRGKSLVGWCRGSYLYSQAEDTHYIIEWEDEEETSFAVDCETVGQYTGLKDKNGAEIYEGDILRCRLYDCTYENYENYLVEYENYRDKYGNNAEYVAYNKDRTNFMSSSIWHKFKIIGNIFDNPELLEETE